MCQRSRGLDFLILFPRFAFDFDLQALSISNLQPWSHYLINLQFSFARTPPVNSCILIKHQFGNTSLLKIKWNCAHRAQKSGAFCWNNYGVFGSLGNPPLMGWLSCLQCKIMPKSQWNQREVCFGGREVCFAQRERSALERKGHQNIKRIMPIILAFLQTFCSASARPPVSSTKGPKHTGKRLSLLIMMSSSNRKKTLRLTANTQWKRW